MGTIKTTNIETITGSGTLTLGQSGETISVPSGATINLSNATQTGVGGVNTPAFLATMSASQNPSSATTTLVNFNQTTYDTASGFDTTNKKYVIPSAGYYHIYANAYMYNTSNDLDRLITYINIDGTTRFQTDVQIPNSPACFCYVGGVYNCSANDDVEVKIYQVMGSGTTTIPTDKNYFGGYKLIS